MEENLVKNYLSMVAEQSGLPHFQASKVRFIDLLYKQLLATAALPMSASSTNEVKINLKMAHLNAMTESLIFVIFHLRTD